ncbi:MAG: hypothetical protein ACYC9O_05980 [Candidatus Latescibacterota bacterium]
MHPKKMLPEVNTAHQKTLLKPEASKGPLEVNIACKGSIETRGFFYE